MFISIITTLLNLFVFLLGIVLIIFSTFNLITSFFSFKKNKYDLFFPRVSVVVRTWNDGDVVERCIKNYLNQDYPKGDYEIIIVDDGSTDETQKICEKYAKSGEIKYVRFEEHSEHKAKVIDYAIENYAIGDIIIETDVDAILKNNFIKTMTRPYQDKKVSAVTGVVMGGNWNRSFLSLIRTMENFWHFCTAIYGRYNLTKKGLIYGGSKSYRKKTWEELDGHSTKTLVEDAEMGAQLLGKDKKIVIVRDSPVIQEEVESISQYFDEQKRWVGGDLEAFKIYKKEFSKNIFNFITMLSNFSIEFLFFISLIGSLFNPLFLIPTMINLISVIIGLISFNAKNKFYIYAIPYLFIIPILRICVILSIAKCKIKKDKIKWKKVWHNPIELKYPTKKK